MGHVASGRGDGASVSSVGSSCSPPQSEEFSDASQERGGRVSRRLGGTPGSDIVSPSTPTGAPIPRRRISSGWFLRLTVCPLYNVGTIGQSMRESLAPVLHLSKSILVHRLYISNSLHVQLLAWTSSIQLYLWISTNAILEKCPLWQSTGGNDG